MRLRLFAVALLLTLPACGDGGGRDAAARDAAADTAKVPAFAGFRWGAPRDSIVARLGAPFRSQAYHEGVVGMLYEDSLAGYGVLKAFYVHPREGLLRGSYTGGESSGLDCVLLQETFAAEVQQRWPGLLREERAFGTPAPTLCAAAELGRAGRAVSFTDVTSGRQIVVSVLPRVPGVHVVFDTPEAGRWERRKGVAP
ncbi:MAG TPA: hypothetical protein VHG91_03975 [Longimicrobium sp.]|nr:hypothetical protein [Longimicrobium sp.]